MIDLVRLQIVKQLHQIYRVAKVSVMQKHPDAVDVRVGVKMVNAGSVERAGAANDAVDLVAFFQQQFGQITSVLAGDAGDQRFLHLGQ